MPSPFPGMDPYLEGELWQEFHETLAGTIRAQLLAQLPASYVALLAKRYVVGTPTVGILPGLGLNILNTDTHLLEIDLLRDGTRIFFEVELPPSPYAIYLSRTERRPLTQVWPASLRQRLPAVPVPLLQPDPDVVLDLQAAVDACFALVGYERLLDYADPPPPPPLEEEDAAWLDDLLHGAGLR